MTLKDYKILELKTGVEMPSLALWEKAFVHKSYLNENRGTDLESNERLEFLGDAVLELVATHHLFENYPKQAEGQMTAFRSALVKGIHLAEVARQLDLGGYLYLSNGEEKSGGRTKNYILANTLEALIGLIYLEKGYDSAARFIADFILNKLDKIITEGLHIDSKTKFQEMAQELEEKTPYYEVLQEEGPDHNKKFVMGAYIDGLLIAKGEGSSKQRATQNAAENALKFKNWQ